MDVVVGGFITAKKKSNKKSRPPRRALSFNCHLSRLITGTSPKSFSTPGNVFSQLVTFCLFIFTTLIPSRQPHSSRVCCGVIMIQSFITRILTSIQSIKPAFDNHFPLRDVFLSFNLTWIYYFRVNIWSCGFLINSWIL